jgi:hypothetical protein
MSQKVAAHKARKSATPRPKRQRVSQAEEIVSMRTTYRWLKVLGFKKGTHKKSVYVDGHERADVVEYRKKFLQEFDEVMQYAYDFEDPKRPKPPKKLNTPGPLPSEVLADTQATLPEARVECEATLTELETLEDQSSDIDPDAMKELLEEQERFPAGLVPKPLVDANVVSELKRQADDDGKPARILQGAQHPRICQKAHQRRAS